MNKLVTYNSQEGELIEDYLKNQDLTKLVESYMFNDAYIRVTLPENASQKTKLFVNLNSILDYKDFTAFYGFHHEKNEAHTTLSNTEFQNRINIYTQELIKTMEKNKLIILDHYLDFRYNRVILTILYIKSINVDDEKTYKIIIKEYTLVENILDYITQPTQSLQHTKTANFFTKLYSVFSLKNTAMITSVAVICFGILRYTKKYN